jgi:hypothetical protein
MIWQYFPVGFRFPVRDFSDETRRACWETTLSALYSADPKGLTLYDAQQTYDAGTAGPVYICIACYYGIKQARANAKKLFAMDDLLIRLCRNTPFMQANALESFGPYPLLGKIEDDNTLTVTEAGEAVLKGVEKKPLMPRKGLKLLIVSDENETEGSAEACTRAIGAEAVTQGFIVQRTVIADGGYGTVRALVGALNGRYESVTVSDANGERRSDVIGILPGPIAVTEAAGRDTATVGALLQKALDLGYRKILLGADKCIDPENANVLLDARDPRLSECECRVLTDEKNTLRDTLTSIGFTAVPGAETVLQTIGFAQSIRESDFALLFTHGLSRSAVDAALCELNAQKKPTCLVGKGPFDIDGLMREYPILRGVVPAEETDESALKRAFLGEVLPMIGKDIAKAARI